MGVDKRVVGGEREWARMSGGLTSSLPPTFFCHFPKESLAPNWQTVPYDLPVWLAQNFISVASGCLAQRHKGHKEVFRYRNSAAMPLYTMPLCETPLREAK